MQPKDEASRQSAGQLLLDIYGVDSLELDSRCNFRVRDLSGGVFCLTLPTSDEESRRALARKMSQDLVSSALLH
jgi:hypothetical protein